MEYRKAVRDELEVQWNHNISDNPGDPRWIRWKEEYIGYHLAQKSVTFLVLDKGDPVGEGTLLLSPECRAVAGYPVLCDGKEIANVNALRIRKEYEGQGHISKLMQVMEADAVRRGITALTIGVDAKETRNLAIYLHWGYTQFLFHEMDEGELCLYFRKDLRPDPSLPGRS